MAINKQISTDYGIDINHTVINNLIISRDENRFSFVIKQYPSSTNYNDGDKQLEKKGYEFNFSQLPGSILTKIQDLKEEMELQMIANIPAFSGGTQVQDNGDPMP